MSFLPLNATSPAETEVIPGSSESTRARAILVVEDSEDDIRLLKLMFRRSQILNPVEAVRTVREAISYLKGEGIYADRRAHPVPTLLFVDLRLGDGSGFDILRWLQGHRAHSPLAVVVLSGSDVKAFKQAYDLGAHSFLVKPLKFDEFENMVQHVRGIRLKRTSERHLLEVDS
jgi:two-component system response regulator